MGLLVFVCLFLVGHAKLGGMMRPPPYVMDQYASQRRRLPKQVYPAHLPAAFDTREAFPGCIHGILNQGQCGSCWAFASTEVLSDRFCIATGGRINVTLSPQSALGCETLHLGCKMGSMPEWAWPFLVRHGVATLQCLPYTAGDGSAPHECQTQCAGGGGEQLQLYRAANYTHAGDFIDASRHTAAIMEALLSGPLDATFIVYDDFDSYQAGTVYQHRSGGFAGLHSVKIVGWGETPAGELYWTVANSWGADWPTPGGPDAGFFKIRRGVDECMFESQVYYGAPLVDPQ